jgi:hypothetical protein
MPGFGKDLIKEMRSYFIAGEGETLKDKILRFIKDNYPGRVGVKFRPSEMSLPHYCIKKEVFRRILGNRVENPEPELHLIFDVGTTMHWWFQNRYFGPMGLLYGEWECQRCHEIVNGVMPKEPCQCRWQESGVACKEKCVGHGMTCGVCRVGKGSWVYREPELTLKLDDKNNIVGHADGILLLGTKKVLEMKTMSKTEWEKLSGGKPEHITQINMIMGLAHLTEGILLYISKHDADLKEFSYQFNQALFDRCVNKAKVIIEFANRKEPASDEFRVCDSADCSHARNCLYRKECFRIEEVKI